MGLLRFRPTPSGRMGILWTLASIKDSALVEFGCMGHMIYSRVFLDRGGVPRGCKLYSTHLNEGDISLGRTDSLKKTIEKVVERDHPQAIFLQPSSIPEMIGTDLEGIAEELKEQFQLPILPFRGGGFKTTQSQGVEEALYFLIKELVEEREKTLKPTFNIIGSCGDLFNFQSDSRELKRLLKGAFQMEAKCILSSEASIEKIREMSSAHISLVIRREGEKGARHLEKNFGVPYLVGRPYGKEGTRRWLESIGELLGLVPDASFLEKETEAIERMLVPIDPILKHCYRFHPEHTQLSLGGHGDVVQGILDYGCGELKFLRGNSWTPDINTQGAGIPYYEEGEWAKAAQEYQEGILMGSGELLESLDRNCDLQIGNPDTKWRLNPYEPPFVGYRGALNLLNLWINEIQRKR